MTKIQTIADIAKQSAQIDAQVAAIQDHGRGGTYTLRAAIFGEEGSPPVTAPINEALDQMESGPPDPLY